ncbi:MAG: rod shape-determining protein RodA [Oligoflexia bacterium]|nr:rod shape-determining protein RodA [Oligoflexia bacterium]
MKVIAGLYDKVLKYDYSITVMSILIVIIGAINLYSATHTSTVAGTAGLFKHQVIFLILGALLMVVFTFIDYRKLERFAYLVYAFNVLLLILVLVFGQESSGSKRWLSLGFTRIQPSEMMKLSVLWALARYFNNDRNIGGYSLKELFVPFMIALLPALLVIIEPDLGTGLIILLIAFSLFMFIKIKASSLIIIAVVGVISLPLVYSFVLKDYQKRRVLTFIDPSEDPRGAGYNSLQSRIAVGSGQLVGKGFMRGTQTQLNFLPEHHTDFIFSVLAEEHGFLGCSVLVILYSLLFFTGIRVSSKARDKLGAILAMGCVFILFWHVLINIGMVIGIMPIVGVTLPFMSYGGSSVIVNFILIGFLQNIAIRRFMF